MISSAVITSSLAALSAGAKTSRKRVEKQTSAQLSGQSSAPLSGHLSGHLSGQLSASAPIANSKPKPQLDELTLSVGQESYLDRTPVSGKKEIMDFTRVSARFRTESIDKPFGGHLEIGGSFAVNAEGETNLFVPQAHLAYEFQSTGLSLALGRKREQWSALDRTWQLGLWQPLNRYDALRPEEQGLTGAFMAFSRPGVRIVGFGTPLFIPEQGATFELQNGRFSSNNPWFSEPTDRAVLFSTPINVGYDLHTPSVGSVISHPAGGGLIRLQNDDGEGAFAQAAFAFKPRNQLSLPIETYLQLADSQQEARVSVHPTVVYHSVVGADLGYESPTGSLSVSGLADIPANHEYESNLTREVYEPLYFLSPSASLKILSQTWVKVSYLQPFGGGSRLEGPTELERSPFGPRTPYLHALSAELTGHVYSSPRWKVGGTLRWIEEIREQASVIMTEAHIDSRTNWRVGAFVDFLASRQPPESNPGFISRYRGNDRVGALLTYIF